MSLTFVVSTGRCGSTMLTQMLHRHPGMLSVSEFLALLLETTPRRDLPMYDMDGRELWRLVASPSPARDALVRSGIWRSELDYPFGTGRYQRSGGVPMICHNVLPSLTGDPDALFDALAERVLTWPRRTAAAQYRALFHALAELTGGRRAVVERSGGSLPALPTLVRQFPDARFVFLHRDGADTALSMSRHFAIRMIYMAWEASLAAGGALPPNATFEQIAAVAPAEYDGLLRPPLDAERFRAYPVSTVFCGERWSRMILDAVAVFRTLPPHRWISMRYEQLLQHPATELSRLADFVGVPAEPGWLDAAAAMVDPGRSGRAPAEIDPGQLADLRARCAPGEQAITQLGRLAFS